jgi:hypothetical protein
VNTPRTDDREGIRLLAEALRGADYTAEHVRDTLILEGPFSRDPHELPVYLRLLPEGTAFATVAKLFLLGTPTAREEAEEALAPASVERLEAMSVLEPRLGGVGGTIDILPWSDRWVASDALAVDLPPSQPDYVLGLHPPSVVLAKLTVRQRMGTLLDIGTGGGVQLLLATEHVERSVGVDLNPRALRYAEFNAVLNGVDDRIELLEGNTYEPVEGRTFDAIVCNPPYVVSPEAQYAFRDGGLPADQFCEQLVREAPRFLNEGGYAHVLASWVHPVDEEWSAPLRRWVEGSGCDALVFHTVSQDPLSYAATWNKALRWDPVAYAGALDRWMDYDRKMGIEAIAWGAVVLRKRSGGRNWFVEHEIKTDGIDEAGYQLLRMAAAQDLLAETEVRDGLLDRSFRLADDHLLDQALHIRNGSGVVRRAALTLDGGFNFRVELDRQAFQLVSILEGRTAREAVEQVAQATEAGSRDEFRALAEPFLRRLLELGFLVEST